MKLKYEMEIIDIDGSPMAVPVDSGDAFRGVLHINGITADVLALLKNDVTAEEIVAALKREYDATEEQLRHSVQKIVTILRDYHLLTE